MINNIKIVFKKPVKRKKRKKNKKAPKNFPLETVNFLQILTLLERF
jgi:hypothetical protein